jgi:hypothetical protein
LAGDAEEPTEFRLPILSLLALFLIRGFLLWLVIPTGTLWWTITWPLQRRRRVRLGQFLGWADLNLVAAIQRTILRPLVQNPAKWFPLRAVPQVTHRIHWADPM